MKLHGLAKMNIWLNRISHVAEASYPLIEKGFLTIGYSDFCSAEFLEKTKSKDWTYFEKSFMEQWGTIPRTRYNLWRFIAEMQVGDWVLVPSWGSFSVYRVDSEACLINGIDSKGLSAWNNRSLTVMPDGLHISDQSDSLDLGFFRKVSAIAMDISRYDFADGALTARMKIRTTNADISDLTASVKKAIEAFHAKRPINLHSQILDASRDAILKLIQEQLNPDKFERLIKWFFEGVGATNVVIPSKNESGKEGDADIVATFDHMRTVYCVQAKLHSGETDSWGVQQVRDFTAQKDRMDDGYTKIGWVVTSAQSFSVECVELAKEHSIGLFTGPDLARMILESGIKDLDKAFA
jgi:predicted Mrr-cat superfamily restriction endonuclease